MINTTTIPFTSFSNVTIEDNSGRVEKAWNVYHDISGYIAAPYSKDQSQTLTATTTVGFLGSIAVYDQKNDKYYNILALKGMFDTGYKLFYYMDASAETWVASTGTIPSIVTKQVDFAQFGNHVIATITNQFAVYTTDISGTPNFAALGGSPPQASTCCVSGDFVILANTYESSVHYPNRIWNSAINDSTGWTAGTNLCDYDDNPDLGVIYKVVGGDYVTIFASGGIATMQRVDDERGWQVDIKVVHNEIIPKNSVIKVNDLIYYSTATGFYVFNGATSVKLGGGKVDPNRKFDNTMFINGGVSTVTASHNVEYNSIIWSETSLHTVYNYITDEFTLFNDLEHDGAANYDVGAFYNGYKLTSGVADMKALPLGIDYIGKEYGYYLSDNATHAARCSVDIKTGFYDLAPGHWVTIKRVIPIGYGEKTVGVSTEVVTEDIDIIAYDETKTIIDTVNITTEGGGRCRQSGRYFKFRNESNQRRISGYIVDFVVRGRR